MAESTGPGRFVWYDLMSPDIEASKQFYTKVLGWDTRVDRPLMAIPLRFMTRACISERASRAASDARGARPAF